jgi:hypothetical protein
MRVRIVGLSGGQGLSRAVPPGSIVLFVRFVRFVRFVVELAPVGWGLVRGCGLRRGWTTNLANLTNLGQRRERGVQEVMRVRIVGLSGGQGLSRAVPPGSIVLFVRFVRFVVGLAPVGWGLVRGCGLRRGWTTNLANLTNLGQRRERGVQGVMHVRIVGLTGGQGLSRAMPPGSTSSSCDSFDLWSSWRPLSYLGLWL